MLSTVIPDAAVWASLLSLGSPVCTVPGYSRLCRTFVGTLASPWVPSSAYSLRIQLILGWSQQHAYILPPHPSAPTELSCFLLCWCMPSRMQGPWFPWLTLPLPVWGKCALSQHHKENYVPSSEILPYRSFGLNRKTKCPNLLRNERKSFLLN